MSTPPSSPSKPASPRKTPPKVVDIASLRDGDSYFSLEAKVTSISGARSFGAGGPDNVFLNVSLMDASGSIRGVCFGATARRIQGSVLPSMVYAISGAKVRNCELRIDDGTRFVPLEDGLLKLKPKLLDSVGDAACEVVVWFGQVSGDPWYYSCTLCKKGCPEDVEMCPKPGCRSTSFTWNLLLKMQVRDGAGNLRQVSGFDEVARKLLGIPATVAGQELFDAVSARMGSLQGSCWSLYLQHNRRFQLEDRSKEILTIAAVGSRLERPDPSKLSPEPVDFQRPSPTSSPGSSTDPIKVDLADDHPVAAAATVEIKQEEDQDEKKRKKPTPAKKAAKRLKLDDDDEE